MGLSRGKQFSQNKSVSLQGDLQHRHKSNWLTHKTDSETPPVQNVFFLLFLRISVRASLCRAVYVQSLTPVLTNISEASRGPIFTKHKCDIKS